MARSMSWTLTSTVARWRSPTAASLGVMADGEPTGPAADVGRSAMAGPVRPCPCGDPRDFGGSVPEVARTDPAAAHVADVDRDEGGGGSDTEATGERLCLVASRRGELDPAVGDEQPRHRVDQPAVDLGA